MARFERWLSNSGAEGRLERLAARIPVHHESDANRSVVSRGAESSKIPAVERRGLRRRGWVGAAVIKALAAADRPLRPVELHRMLVVEHPGWSVPYSTVKNALRATAMDPKPRAERDAATPTE